MVQIKSLGNFTPPTPRQTLEAAALSSSTPSTSAPPKSGKGKGKQKSSSSSAGPSPSLPTITPSETTLLHLLATFSAATLSSPTFSTQLQDLKGLLYHKQYAEAFSTSGSVGDLRRDIYAARWVPSRSIIYCRVFEDLRGLFRRAMTKQDGQEKVEIVCIGGGAGSEVASIGRYWVDSRAGAKEQVRVTCLDMGDWGALLKRLEVALRTEWTELDGTFEVAFVQQDILSPTPDAVDELEKLSLESAPSRVPYATASVLTIFFTLSELFLQSLPSTLSFLRSLSTSCRPGCLLIIIESASLSTIPLGKNGRIYSIATVVDHALGADEEGRKGGEKTGWELVDEGQGEEGEGKWYRMPNEAQEAYDEGKGRVKLEGSRVVVRAYRKR